MVNHEILREHSDNAISAAIEGNLITFIAEDMMNIPQYFTPQVERNEEMLRYYSGIQFAVENGVYVRRFQEVDLEHRVVEQIEFFRSRKVPHMWYFGAGSSPHTIEDILLDNGLVKSEWDNPAMAADLRILDEAQISNQMKRSGAIVTIVTSEEKLEGWMEVFRATSGWPEEANTAYHHTCKHMLKDTERAMLILAEIDGQPAGISLSILSEGVVGLYSVGTLEEYRRKGVGTLVSLAAMIAGKEKGYEIGVLFSSQMGQRVYSRIGFKEHFKYRFFMDFLK